MRLVQRLTRSADSRALLDRCRLGFLILNLANLAAVLLAMAAGPARAGLVALSVLAGLCLGVGDMEILHRRRIRVLDEVTRAAAMVVVSLSLPDVTMTISLIFSAVMFRSLYGRHLQAVLRVAWYVAAYAVILVLAQRMHHLSTTVAAALLLPLAALSMSMATMRVLLVAAGQRDRAAARQQVLADTATALLNVEDRSAMSALVWRAQSRLLADLPDVVAFLLTTADDSVHIDPGNTHLDSTTTIDGASVRDALQSPHGRFAVPHPPPALQSLVPAARCWYFVPAADGDTDTRVLVLAGARRVEHDALICSETLMRQTALAARTIAQRAQLHHQAWHDELTGLPNRKMFLHRLAQRCDPASPGAPLAVLYIDLDGFKPVNDLHGHHAGDTLLRALGHRLAAAVGPDDLVARLGGDEFAVLLSHLHHDDAATQLAARLEALLSEPVPLGNGTTVAVGASIGIHIAEGGQDPEHLLSQADTAMYRTKADHQRLPAQPVAELVR